MHEGAWIAREGVGPPPRAEHQPFLNAPWPVLALVGAMLAAYALQSLSGRSDAAIDAFGFSPASLTQGRWSGLVTALFLHGGWAHVGLNALAALAFGVPVARLFGKDVRGVLAFFAFYLACGAISSLGYAGLHWGAPSVLVGASGAVSGLMGAASRLIERRPGLAPLASPTVVGMAAAWIVVNGLIALSGFSVGAGGVPVAWEAHLVGYAAGLLTVWPIARALRRI